MKPGSPTEDAKKLISERPFVAHLASSSYGVKAENWCRSVGMDFYKGMPNPMYWRFKTKADRDRFVLSGFGEHNEYTKDAGE